MNSTHKAEVVRVGILEKHPNADTLSIVRVGEYQVLVRTDDWNVGDLGVYIQPDSVVPDSPEYSFLQGHRRIKAKRLRGVWSQGLLMPAPSGASEGDDVAEQMGITHYVPPSELRADRRSGPKPPFAGVEYDVDTWYKYSHLIPEGTRVQITEKIHGMNARFTWQRGKLWVSSRRVWHRNPLEMSWYQRIWYWVTRSKQNKQHDDVFWKIAEKYPQIEEFLKANPGWVLYGEVYGRGCQELEYGCSEPSFAAFDVQIGPGEWLEASDKRDWLEANRVPVVPLLWEGFYTTDKLREFISGPSTVVGANHLREGCVVTPMREMLSPEIGRVVLKAVSPEYLEKYA